jgi:hypothetical protein
MLLNINGLAIHVAGGVNLTVIYGIEKGLPGWEIRVL